MELTPIFDDCGKVYGYIAARGLLSGQDVQDAMKRLEQLETERKELGLILRRCRCIVYDCAPDSETLLIQEIARMTVIMEDEVG